MIVAIGGPMGVASGTMREDAEQVAQVRLGVEAVEPTGRDEREQVCGALAVVVAADEEPRLASDGDGAAERALGAIV